MLEPRGRLTRALALVAAVAPLLCLPGFYDAANLPQTAWIAVAGWAWIGCAWLWSGPPQAAAPRALIAALGWAALTLTWAENPAPGFRLWLHWATCAALFVSARALWRQASDAAPVWWALTGATTLVAALGLAQSFAGFSGLPQGIAPAATFVNKNVAAGFIVLAWPLAALLLSTTRSNWQRGLLTLALGLQALYVGVATSRSAWLAGAGQLAFGALLVVRSPHGRRVQIPALIALIVLGGSWLVRPAQGPAPGPLGAIAMAVGTDEPSVDAAVVSVRGRLAVWANTLVMIADRPLLGLGLGGHARAYPPYAHAARPDPLFRAERQLDFVHNDFLQLTAELGLVGLGLAGALLAGASLALRRACRSAREDQRRLAWAVVAMLLGACIDACFAFPFERALPPFLLALAAAAVTAGEAETGPRGPRRAAWLAFAIAAIASFVEVRWLAADHHFAQAQRARARGDLIAARRDAERAAALDPQAPGPLFALGQLAIDERRPKDALAWLDRALRIRPHDPATLGTRAAAFGLQGDLERATADAQRVAELLQRDPGAWYELGRWFERGGRSLEAREAFGRASRLDPANSSYQLRRAVTALRSGARPEAEQAARAALALDPRSALAHKLLGLVLLEEPTRAAEGRHHIRAALELDGSISDAARLRALLSPEARQP